MNTLLTQINIALDALILNENGFAFQRLAHQCLRSRWPSLASVPLHRDLGEDGITILDECSDDVIRSLACSITAELSTVRKNASTIIKHRSDVKELIFATPRTVTREEQVKWEKDISEKFDFKLIVVERSEFLRILESPEYRWICEQHLNILETDLERKLFKVKNKHSIDALRNEDPFLLGVWIDDLIKEEESSTPSAPIGMNTLIVGPPFIGKTCWALRRAWRTRCNLKQSSILWFNAIKDSAEDLTFLNNNLRSLEEDYIIVIDDIHTARANTEFWTRPAAAFASNRSGRVRVLWIARDESIADFLTIGSNIVKIDHFPIELVVGLFLNQLKSLPRNLRIIVALEAGLDPALGRAMKSWASLSNIKETELVDRISNEKYIRVCDVLTKMKNKLKESYSAYLGLLPFGSIAIPVEGAFVADMVKSEEGIVALSKIENAGLCTHLEKNELLLTEHPFQLRRTLEYLDQGKTETCMVQRFAFPGANPKPDTLSESVLSRYVWSSSKPKDVLLKLNEYAEWAGVLDPMASAARYIVKATSDKDTELREKAREIAMKLSRTAYPDDENAYVAALEYDLQWWEHQHATAAADPDEICAGRRLDYILYEEAYIHYLLERYEQATRIFRASVEAGFRAIDRALGNTSRTPETIMRAQYALSNIWIGGLLEQTAALRGHLFKVLNRVFSYSVEQSNLFAERIAKIYSALATALKSGENGLKTGEPFLYAAREALCPGHSYPTNNFKVDLRDQEFTKFLRRHLFNSWLQSLETSCWSWLFLDIKSEPKPILGVPKPSPAIFKLLAPLSDQDSLIAYRFKQTELLYRAADGKRLKTSAALKVAAMLRAGGSFEYLGDHLLLAWKTTKIIKNRRAIEWFLKERVPDVGFNKLPKLALNYLKNSCYRSDASG